MVYAVVFRALFTIMTGFSWHSRGAPEETWRLWEDSGCSGREILHSQPGDQGKMTHHLLNGYETLHHLFYTIMLLTKGQEVFVVENVHRCTTAMYLQNNLWIKFSYREILCPGKLPILQYYVVIIDKHNILTYSKVDTNQHYSTSTYYLSFLHHLHTCSNVDAYLSISANDYFSPVHTLYQHEAFAIASKVSLLTARQVEEADRKREEDRKRQQAEEERRRKEEEQRRREEKKRQDEVCVQQCEYRSCTTYKWGYM